VAGGYGTGVAIASVDRASSPELTGARRGADGDLAFGQAQVDALQRLERSLGTVGDADSLSARITDFEGALRQLAETPELSPRQAAAAQAASDLAVKLNQISAESTHIRQTADDEIARQVAVVNGALGKIARLNRQIQVFASGDRNIASLVDQRERLIDQVAAIVPIRENARSDGVVELTTAQGLSLADTRANEIAFTPSPVITPAMRYDQGAGALGGMTLNGVDITPGGHGTQSIRGGSLAGLFDVRDRIALEFSDRADALAADLIGRVTAPGVDPTLTPSDSGLLTDAGAPYDAANLAGLSGRIRLNAAVDPRSGGDFSLLRDGLGALTPGPAGNGTLPRAILDALNTPAASTVVPGLTAALTFARAAEGLAEIAAVGRVSAEADVAGFSSSRNTLAAAEAGQIGVDSDAEMQALIDIEHAYAANAQVIQAAARMLDQLLEI